MSLSFTEDHDQLRGLVREFLQDRSPSSAVRRVIASDANRDDEVWTQLADQLGLTGLALPEEFGGSGFGPIELGIVLEEMGRALFVGPYFASVVLAGQTLALSGDESAQRAWLPGIAAGTLAATLAVVEESGSWDVDAVATRAQLRDGEWVLSGVKLYVVDGCTAELILVVAQTDDGLGVFAVEGVAAGVVRTKLSTLDQTRELAEVVLQDAPGIRIGGERDAREWLSEVYDHTLAALASEQIGGAARCLELAVEYAKLREQFDRPIGSFQAIKHKCALLLLEVESGRSAVYHANAALAHDDPESTISAAVAKAQASRAFTQAAKDCIQIHGGIGYTWEHDAHLYLRRAKSSELLFGTPREQRARIADLAGI